MTTISLEQVVDDKKTTNQTPIANSRKSQLRAAWSYALHNVIRTANKEKIAIAIAPYATHPLHQKYPLYLLHDNKTARMGYEHAREEYCKQFILPQLKKMNETLEKVYIDVTD